MSASSGPGGDYLWDRSEPRDREVAELERLLSRFGQRSTPRAAWRRPSLLMAAALLGVAAALWFALHRQAVAPPRLRLAFSGGAGSIAAGTTFTATPARRELELLGKESRWLGAFTFTPGSAVRVLHLNEDLTRLFLEHGRLEAFVAADAKERFFQVDTPSARCVDLGCRYTLTVARDGTAEVLVTFGQVAFENSSGGEVFVPAGASCRARRAQGLGTPRFSDGSPELASRLDRYDEAAGQGWVVRRRLAGKALAAARQGKDTLALWHLLAAGDAVIRAGAEAALVRLAGYPPEARRMKAMSFSRAQWRAHLEPLWER